MCEQETKHDDVIALVERKPGIGAGKNQPRNEADGNHRHRHGKTVKAPPLLREKAEVLRKLAPIIAKPVDVPC